MQLVCVTRGQIVRGFGYQPQKPSFFLLGVPCTDSFSPHLNILNYKAFPSE